MSRAATSVWFGYDFQANAAIVLMLEHIQDMSTIRLEGYEDIEIQLNDGSYVLAQAKAVVDASTDFRNVRANSKKAIETLSEASHDLKIHKMVYITNTPNPFKDTDVGAIYTFSGRAYKKYADLPPSTKGIISDLLPDIEQLIDTAKFEIQVLPFESDDDRHKYRYVIDGISDFIGNLDITYDGLRNSLHDVWNAALTKSGTRKNESIKLRKKDIVWPIIVFVTGNGKLNREAEYCNLLDDGEYNEVSRKYRRIIDDYCERFEFVTKILSGYSSSGIQGRDRITSYINEHWEEFKSEIGEDVIDERLQCSLVKIVMFNVLNRRFEIDNIKRYVNL